jgi:hypothetical protein
MKSLFFFALIGLLLQVDYLSAQTVNQSSLKPRVGITILSDGQPINQKSGIKRNTKEISFKALLDTKADSSFQDFQSELSIKNIQVILARNGRSIAQIDVANGHLPTDLTQQAQSMDHLILKFTLVAQRKNGELIPLSEQRTYNFPIRE